MIGVAAGGVAILAAVALLGSGATAGSDGRAVPETRATPGIVPSADAASLLARGDYAGAETAYRERVQRAPHDLDARYALGIALSYLDRAAETTEQFEWIVAHGAPGRKEVASARRWLEAARPRDTRDETRTAEATLTDVAAPGAVKGITQWPGVTPETKRTKLELRLVGDEPAVESTNIKLYISLGAPYRFTKLRPGRYRLVGRTDTQELWNTKVVVEAGTDSTLDLTPQNSVATPEPATPRPA